MTLMVWLPTEAVILAFMAFTCSSRAVRMLLEVCSLLLMTVMASRRVSGSEEMVTSSRR